MKLNTKNYSSYTAMIDDLSNEEIGKNFVSDLEYVAKNHPEIHRLLLFLWQNAEYIKENVLNLMEKKNDS